MHSLPLLGKRALLGGLLVALSANLLSAPAAHADEERHRPFEVGVYGGAYIFNSEHGLGRNVGDPEGFSPKTSVEIGARFGWGITRRFGIEAEVHIVPTATKDGGTNVLVFGYRGHVMFNFLTEGMFRPFILAGFGGLSSVPSDDKVVPGDTDSSLYAGLGAKFFVTPAIAIRLDGRIGAPPSFLNGITKVGNESEFGGPDFEVLLGVSFAFGGEEPAAAPPPPEEPKDSDGDGILDPNDKCPNEPEDKDNFQDEDGCPDPDNDADGILDTNDKCPNDAEDKDNFQDEDGCPDPDNDADGILDTNDKCPNEPETKNNYQDEDGCPDTVPGPVQKFTGVIQGIKFKFNKADITRDSFSVLDKAAAVLKEFGDVKLEIQGHTDNVGNAAYNKDLSQRRADSVRDYLIGKGIDAGRLSATGYGMEAPIADNKTEKGRAQNRRVEFKLK